MSGSCVTVSWCLLRSIGIAAVTIEQFIHLSKPDSVSKKTGPPLSSIALNVFDVSFPDEREHFLALMLLAFLDHDGAHRNLEYFVRSDVVISEMQNWGYLPQQSVATLRKLTNKKLIETTERVTFDEDAMGNLIGELPAAFRITSVGAYHLKRWVGTFGYLDAMAFDTPIFRDEAMRSIAQSPSSFDIVERYARTRAFRDYLAAVWNDSGLRPPYLDWRLCAAAGEDSFRGVEGGIRRFGKTIPEGPTSTR